MKRTLAGREVEIPFIVDGNVGVQTQKAEWRQEFLFQRRLLDRDLKNTTQWKAINHLRTLHSQLAPAVIGAYWPIRGEIDIRPWLHELYENGDTVALPRVAYRGHPLVYNIWEPGMQLDLDATGVPCATGPEILPAVMVIPMLGYSAQGYRLGYGGGYYDMTLKMMDQPALTIGVCYTAHEIPHFPKEYHDQRLDYIVTGKGVV